MLATAATSLACGALAYVQFVKPLAAFDYRVEAWGFLLSMVGIIFGLVTLRFPRWFFFVGTGRLGVDACALLFGGFDILKSSERSLPLAVVERSRFYQLPRSSQLVQTPVLRQLGLRSYNSPDVLAD